MIELRHHPLLDCWVLVAKSRAARPDEFFREPVKRLATRCPFCEGNESDTPPALSEYRSGDGGPWLVRVVPNKYPAITPYDPNVVVPAAPSPHGGNSDLFHSVAREGRHEVVIESPRHVARFGKLTADEARLTVLAWRDRLRWHGADSRVAYALVFKNFGASGGASLEHTHSQIVAMPWIPPVIRTECRQLEDWRARHGACLICQLVEAERELGIRVVAKSEHFLAYCPYASRFPYEVWLAPLEHQSAFEFSADAMLAELAELMRAVLDRVERLPALRGYNVWLHTTPLARESQPLNIDFHWHIEIMPRITQLAGFEWGGGDYINTVPPEEAADYLRRS